MTKSFDNIPKSRALRMSAPVPKTKFRLLGANGQTITPPAAKTLSPAASEAAPPALDAEAQAEYDRQLAEYERQMAEYNQQMEQFEKEKAAAEAAAAADAAAEAAAAAVAEATAAAEAASAAAAAASLAAMASSTPSAPAEEAPSAVTSPPAIETPPAIAAPPVIATPPAVEIPPAVEASAPVEAAAPVPDAPQVPNIPDTLSTPEPAPAQATVPQSRLRVATPAMGASKLKPAVAASAAKPAAAKPAAAKPAAAPQPVSAQASVPKSRLRVATPAAATAAAATAPAATAQPATGAPKLAPAGSKLKPATAGAPKQAGAAGGLKARAAATRATTPPSAAAAEAASETGEGEAAEQESGSSYLDSLNQQNVTPFWKNKLVIASFAFLVGVGIFGTYTVMDNNAREAKRKARENEVNALLVRSQKINRAGIEKLADAKKKKMEIKCSPKDAELLLSVVIDPFEKDEFDRPRYGGNAEAVAQNACLLLGLAAEQDPKIASLIFDKLGENASKIKPSLFSWMIQRMAVAEVDKINNRLATLSKEISEKPKFKNKPEILASIWEVMGLRVTEKDIPAIMALLESKDLNKELASTLSNCLGNILMMIDDEKKKQKLGDDVFEELPEKYRSQLLSTLGSTKSAKARAYYEKRMEDPKNWRTDTRFFSSWGDDSILPYLIELRGKASNEREEAQIKGAIGTLFTQNRDRDQATVDQMLAVLYDKINSSSADWDAIINKTDPAAAAFVGEDSPEYPKLMERRKELEAIRAQKLSLLRALGRLNEQPWVLALLDRFAKDSDSDVKSAVKKARESTKNNTLQDQAMRARYKERTGEK